MRRTVANGKGKGKGKGKGPLIPGNASKPADLPSPSRLPSADFEISHSELVLHEQIGSGGFGSVKRGRWKGTDVAVKELWVNDSEYVHSLRTEVAVMAALRHPNIVLFMGASTTPPKLAMVTEYVPRGNLRHLLNDDNVKLSWRERCRLAIGTARGMIYLHAKNLMHRDMKSYNLLVTDSLDIKICDFGLARVVPRNLKMTMKGTDYYMAPEVLAGKPYGNPADVYSFGIVLLELITNELPDDLADMIKADPELKKTKAPAGCPAAFFALAVKCINADPKKRPDFDKIAADIEAIMAKLPEESVSSSASASASASSSAGTGAISITDTRGREFWSSKFGDVKKVPWSDFADALRGASKVTLSAVETLSGHLKDPLERGWVTQGTFSTFLSWFGAFPEGVSYATRLFAKPYFAGNIDQVSAAKMLAGAEEGTFLARISASRPGSFSIAVVKGGQVRHSAVLRDAEGRLTIDNKRSFADLPEFVDAHKFLFVNPYKKK